MRALILVPLLAACTAVLPADAPRSDPSLDGRVELVTDTNGWPHAFATTLKDAAFAEGYAMARDRMPQLELFRRTANGRLAEVFGAVSAGFIESDVTMRTIGLHQMAEQLWAQVPAEGRMRDMFEGYSAGVNLYLSELRSGQARAPRGSEVLLGPRTPDWTPVDSLAVLRLMEMFLAFNADAEINRSLLRDRARAVFEQADAAASPELAARRGFISDVLRFAPPSDAATVPGFYPASGPTGRRLRQRAPKLGEAAAALASLRRVLPAKDRLGVGTNAWAVSGANTPSGHALLANDPHLPLVSPSILWGVHFTVAEGPDAVDVTGVAFPGVPGVVFGHNPFVAWGITNAMFDQMDVYEETLTADSALFNGKQVPLSTRVEHIPNGVGGTLDVTVEVVPHHGPLLPVFAGEGVVRRRTASRAISVRWVAAEPSHEVEGLIALMYSKSSGAAKLAVRDIEVPSMGFVFADSLGDIAFQMTGKLPIRSAGARTFDPVLRPDGTLPAMVLPGTGEAEWEGWLDRDALPCTGATPPAFLAAANNDPAWLSRDGNPFDAPVYLGYDWSEGFRAERITERLDAMKGTATREDMEALQADTVMLVAKRFMPFLLEAASSDPRFSAVAEPLRTWNFDATQDSIAATVFHAWLARVVDLTLTDELEALKDAAGESPVLAPQPRMIAVLALLEHPERARTGAALWDDLTTLSVVETRDEILVKALDAAVADLTAATGEADPSRWQWGALHTVRFKSVVPHFSLALGADLSIPQFGDKSFPRGFPRAGGIDTIHQGWPVLQDESGRPAAVFNYTQGPARRFNVEMTPEGPLAFDALPGGESGDLSSPHYRDEAELWRTNKTHRLWRTKAEVDANAESRTVLQPPQ